MGLISSTFGDFYSTHAIMGFQNELEFRTHQIEWIELGKSWGRAEALSQAQTAGLIGGGTGTGGSPYGFNLSFWRTVNYGMKHLALLFIPASTVMATILMFVNGSSALMFAALWTLITFASHFLMFHTEFGRLNIIYSTIPLWSIVGGGAVAAIISFFGYEQIKDEGISMQTKLIISGVAVGIVIAFVSVANSLIRFSVKSAQSGVRSTPV